MTRKHTLDEHYEEIAKEIANRLDVHEVIFDGSYEDQDDDFDIIDTEANGASVRVTGHRADGGKITFNVNVTDIEIEEGTS
jgi:hypothetical protein